MNEFTHRVLLVIHVIFGSIGLISGTINMVRKKSGKGHRIFGLVFVFAMSISATLAMYMSIFSKNQFMFFAGGLALYMSLSGYRALQHFRSKRPPRYNFWDYFSSIFLLIFSVLLFVLGIKSLIYGFVIGIAPLMFAILSIRYFLFSDVSRFRNHPVNKLDWLKSHIAKMCGAYMAASTAFLVNNAQHIPIPKASGTVFFWILPTIIVFPISRGWVKKYSKSK